MQMMLDFYKKVISEPVCFCPSYWIIVENEMLRDIYTVPMWTIAGIQTH